MWMWCNEGREAGVGSGRHVEAGTYLVKMSGMS
jgi:hypothetical protein